MKKKIVMLLCLGCLVCFAATVQAKEYRLGVLAKNGPVKALTMWQETGNYLSAKLPGSNFTVVPLDFDAVFPAIKDGKVDFFLVNSSMFVTAKVKFGAQAVATMINSRQGQPLKSFGGVIITLAENDAINKMSDIKGKTFMAVKKSSFGGWQMAFKELLDAGIDPAKDFAKLDFGGKHDNVVLAVLNEVVDAGTVRTDTLERMAATGALELDEIKIVNPQKHAGFPFVCSTALYPEWPLARTKAVSKEFAAQVLAALKQLAASDAAAQKAKIMGWTDALDYGPVEGLQKKLKVGAFSK